MLKMILRDPNFRMRSLDEDPPESGPARVIPETPQFGLLDSDDEMNTDMEELFLPPSVAPATPSTAPSASAFSPASHTSHGLSSASFTFPALPSTTF